MNTPRVTEGEYRFCLILWDQEPIKSTELVKLCAQKLGWKETTTYTVMKRLSDRGVIKNEKTIVSSLVSKDAVQAAVLDDMMERTFEGSLPAFVAAFTRSRRLSDTEIDTLQTLIDHYRKETHHD